MSIVVGVRVRPFNQREKTHESVCCIDMLGNNQTKIIDDTGKEKTFTFDHSFWSHDGFRTLENGYMEPEDDKYADQKIVFDTVGKQILDNAWQGYHCCLFAYGQTGAGKSYSMVGYGENKGIVPISCNEIFRRIGENKDPEKSFEVQVSMLEIYNEKVQDLLINPNKRPSNVIIKLDEEFRNGVFQNITFIPKGDFENPYDLSELIDKFKSLNPNYNINNLVIIDELDNYSMTDVVGVLNE